MSDLISRQEAIDAWKNDFKGYINALNMPRDDYNGIMQYIDELSSAEPERKVGMWNIIQGNIVVCSECGMAALETMTGCLINRHLEPNRTNFCPNCGAKMEE